MRPGRAAEVVRANIRAIPSVKIDAVHTDIAATGIGGARAADGGDGSVDAGVVLAGIASVAGSTR